ncbi:hypothetical protein ES703_76057 [subsurface metagenome]
MMSMEMFKVWSFLVVVTLGLLVCSSHGRAQQDFDRERYYRAVEYCRGDVLRPLALSPDGQVLCFDGEVAGDLDVSPARGLKENGLFVVRSPGGSSATAVELAEIVGDHHATVIVYDHCFSACAVFFLIASDQTYVLNGALVTWHHLQERSAGSLCTYMTEPAEGRPKKVQRGPCQTGGELGANFWPDLARFFGNRTIGSFDPPPDSLYVRRIIRNLYAETGVFPNIAWTLHPRNYPVLFKTKIFYEAYPQSQEEVDVMAVRSGSGRVIYDP